jgi:hypothetical protein
MFKADCRSVENHFGLVCMVWICPVEPSLMAYGGATVFFRLTYLDQSLQLVFLVPEQPLWHLAADVSAWQRWPVIYSDLSHNLINYPYTLINTWPHYSMQIRICTTGWQCIPFKVICLLGAPQSWEQCRVSIMIKSVPH